MRLSIRDLRDVDTYSYSDPFCVVSIAEKNAKSQTQWIQKGHTEVNTIFILLYFF